MGRYKCKFRILPIMIILNMICPKITPHDLRAVIALLNGISVFLSVGHFSTGPPGTTWYHLVPPVPEYTFETSLK
jgi:hypothetical protein